MTIITFVKCLFQNKAEEPAKTEIDNINFEVLDIYNPTKSRDTLKTSPTSPASLCRYESNSKQYYRPSLSVSNSKRTSIRKSGVSTASGTSFGVKSAFSFSNGHSVKTTAIIQLNGDDFDYMDHINNNTNELESSQRNSVSEVSKDAYYSKIITTTDAMNHEASLDLSYDFLPVVTVCESD